VSQLPGIYIHIPFCERKCAYCSFNTTDFAPDLATRYVGAVCREIRSWGDTLTSNSGKCKADTIYLGGGTPSIIEAGLIRQLIDACRGAFEIAEGAEVTIEINPGAISPAKAGDWLRSGINRVSVGAQSFIDRELFSLTRTHSSETTRRTVALLRDAGFNNLSLDLIAGLPHQTLVDWEYNLNAALSLRPDHLSLYMLEVKPGTLHHAQHKPEQTELPQEDDAASK
jgi:oxygen-independent coproporphyrinogen-3 oxidase